jgi:hypothetical protein
MVTEDRLLENAFAIGKVVQASISNLQVSLSSSMYPEYQVRIPYLSSGFPFLLPLIFTVKLSIFAKESSKIIT